MYFLLRRIFLRVDLARDTVRVSKGLLLRRQFCIPFSAVTKVEVRRTPVLRLLRGKRVEISTLSGGVSFYMKAVEHIPFLPENDGAYIRAKPFQSVVGAFVDTRALSGVITFGLFLNRIGSVFGDESFGRIMTALAGAAEGVTKLLAALHIGVPRVTAFAAVFVGVAWLFVFLGKALGMLRFRLSCESGFITVQRGILTLYECRLVRNNLTGVLRCDTLTTLLLRAAPLYAHDVLLFPTMKPLNGVKDEIGVNKTESEAPKAEPEKIDFSKVEIEPLFKDFVDFETFSKSDFRAVKVLACEAVPKSKKLLKFTLDDGTGAERTILSGIHSYYEPEELVGKTCIAITNLPPRPMMGIDSCGMLISAVHHEEGEEKLHLLMVDDHIPAGAKLY